MVIGFTNFGSGHVQLLLFTVSAQFLLALPRLWKPTPCAQPLESLRRVVKKYSTVSIEHALFCEAPIGFPPQPAQLRFMKRHSLTRPGALNHATMQTPFSRPGGSSGSAHIPWILRSMSSILVIDSQFGRIYLSAMSSS